MKYTYEQVRHAVDCCAAFIKKRDLPDDLKHTVKCQDDEYVEKQLNLLREFFNEQHDTFNRKWLGLKPHDSVCAAAVPLGNKIDWVHKNLKIYNYKN